MKRKYFAQFQKYNRTGVNSLGIRSEKLKGGVGQVKERYIEDDKNNLFIMILYRYIKRRARVSKMLYSYLTLCISPFLLNPPPFFNFLRHIKKSNHAGVK